jgi:signal peptidase I
MNSHGGDFISGFLGSAVIAKRDCSCFSPCSDFILTMGLFTPRYLKDARFLSEAASKTLHHHRDLLREDQISGLQGQIAALNAGIASRDEAAISRLTRDLEVAFSGMIPAKAHAAWAENIEAIVVAVALAIGFQAYFLKPFKIPTGSMQPTLYGMTGHPSEDPLPGPLLRAVDFVRLGRTHLDDRAKVKEQVLAVNERPPLLNFFTFTDVVTTAGRHRIFAPKDVLMRDFGILPGRVYDADEPIVHGYVQAGDQVFVDRMTYQFRNPALSDVFVFRTTGIRRIEMNLDPALGSQFYIKRLAGLPEETLTIDPPRLFIDGSVAEAPPFKRVMSCKEGYRGYSNGSDFGPNFPYLGSPKESFTVPSHAYFALGDNSYNSSDSRYWGIVPEGNVIGRGFFVYWPFSDRWGFIR